MAEDVMATMRGDDPAAFMEHVYAVLRDGHAARAEELLREGARRFPEDPEVALMLGSLLRAMQSDDAAEHVRRAAALAAGDPGYLTRNAEQMLLLGDYPAARELVRQASSVAPEDFEHAGELAYVTGRLMIEVGRDDLAGPLLEDAFEHTPWIADHGLALAEFHAAHGRRDRALEVVARALEHQPDDEWLLALRTDLEAAG
jgi:tetratricopeptide (TPR) repeat protein